MDILSNLTSLLGQGAASQPQQQQGGADPLGGLLDSNALGGLVGALFGGKGGAASPTAGAQASAGGLGGLGSLLGSLMGAGAGAGAGGAGAGAGAAGGLGSLLGSLMGGDGAAPQMPVAPAHPAPATPENRTTNLLRALVYAARADGKIDAQEQQALNEQVRKMNLNAAVAQKVVNQALSEKLDPANIAKNITGADEALNIFALSCALTQMDTTQEQRYLTDLGEALGIPVSTQTAIVKKMLT